MIKIALDNSSAVFLAKLGLFKTLENIQFITTKDIEEEIQRGIEKGYRDAFVRKDLIEQKRIIIQDPKEAISATKKYKLTKADASVIQLAKEQNIFLSTEDEQQRKIAQAEGIKVTNTAALIFYAYHQKKVEKKQAIYWLDLLQNLGYRKEAIIKVKEKILLEE